MSWDGLIINGRDLPASVADLPKDWQPDSMGNAIQIRQQIIAILPDIDWQYSRYGLFDGDGYSIEFSFDDEVGIDGEVTNIGLRIVGTGDPISAIIKVCKANYWAAIDCSSGDFIDLNCTDSANDSWQQFQAYRDRVLKHNR